MELMCILREVEIRSSCMIRLRDLFNSIIFESQINSSLTKCKDFHNLPVFYFSVKAARNNDMSRAVLIGYTMKGVVRNRCHIRSQVNLKFILLLIVIKSILYLV